VEKSAFHIRTALRGINKGVIHLLYAQRVCKFTKVHLECRCNRMYDQKRLPTSIKEVWYLMLIKITPVKI
jgi:hypothetical protein